MKENIFEKICSDSSVLLPDNAELNELLEAEIAKENPDTELIDELISAIAENDNLIIPDIDIENQLFSIKRKAGINRRKGLFKQKKAAIAAVVALIAVGNISTLTVSGENLFTAAFRKGEQIFIDLKKIKNDSQSSKYDFSPPTTDDDPYGIRYFCSVYDEIPPVVPTWIPDNLSYHEVTLSNTDTYSHIVVDFKEYGYEKEVHKGKSFSINYYFFNNRHDLVEYLNHYKENNSEKVLFEDDNCSLTAYTLPQINVAAHSIFMCRDNVLIQTYSLNLTDEEAFAILDAIR